MVRLRFDTDLGGTLTATNDVAKATDKLGKNFDETAASAKKLEQAAKRIVDQNLSPQEKYNQKIEAMAKAVKAGKLSMDDAEKTAARLRTRLDETGQASAKSFGSAAAAGLKSYVLGLASVSTAMALVSSEIEAIKAESEKTTQTQLTAAGARDVLKRNIAPMGRDAGVKFEKRADALAGELGLSQKYIDVALAEAVSSSDNEDQAFSRVRAAAKFLKTRPEGIGAFAGSLGDISKATKSSDDQRNLGFLIAVSARSRVADDQKFSDTYPAAAAGASAFGATAEESGALFDALGQAAADNEGRITGTGVIQLASQLKDKVKGGSFAERLAKLRSNPRAAKKFVEDSSFEAKVKGPLQEFLLDPNSPIAKSYEDIKGSFGTVAEQRARASEVTGYLDEGRTAGTAAVERTIGARAEQFRLSKDADLTSESRSEIVQRYSDITGSGYTAGNLRAYANTGLSMSPGEAIERLETALKEKPGLRTIDKELIENTQKMIDELKAIREKQEKTEAPRPSGRQQQ